MNLGARQSLLTNNNKLDKDKTFICIQVTDTDNTFLIENCHLYNTSNPCEINFGDGYKEYITATSLTHTYSKNGQYIIEIENNLKSFGLGKVEDTCNSYLIKQILKIGSNVNTLPAHFCRGLQSCNFIDASNAIFTTCSNAEFFNCCVKERDGTQITGGHIILPKTLTSLGGWTFEYSRGIQILTFMGTIAPSTNISTTFGTGNDDRKIGYYTWTQGINELRVPYGSSGYNTGQFSSKLLNSSWCNFKLVYF